MPSVMDITAEQVIAAYEKIGALPGPGSPVFVVNGERRCCALGALAHVKDPDFSMKYQAAVTLFAPTRDVLDLLELTENQDRANGSFSKSWDFVQGFDFALRDQTLVGHRINTFTSAGKHGYNIGEAVKTYFEEKSRRGS